MSAGEGRANLPPEFYDGYDVRLMPDGGKEYTLPHTLYGTVLALVTTGAALVVVAAVTLATTASDGFTFWNLLLHYIGVHLAAAFTVMLWALVTGYRCVTRIAIREDGIVWNGDTFFSVRHIREISYGRSCKGDYGDEIFEPLVTIQLGVKTIVLADHLEPVAAKLFMRDFEYDIRRYWYRHN